MQIAIIAPASTQRSLDALLSALLSLNLIFLQTNLGIPPLYRSGVRYRRENRVEGSEERWGTIPQCLDAGLGDCEELAAWRAAEMIWSGEDPSARPEIYHVRPGLWHVRVRRGDGSLEDPSRILGMGGHP